jgi:hypothetical protein
MAVVEVWQRGVIPEARVAVPSSENSVAEQFGRSLQEVGEAGTQVASDIERAREIEEERDWQVEQPKIAKEIAQAGIDFASFYADAKARAPADLTGLQEQVAKWWDDRKATIAGGHASQRALDYLDLHTLDLKGQGIASAIRDTTTATIQFRGDNIQSVVDAEANRLTSDPGAYKSSIANVMATLDAQKGAIPETTLNEWRIAARQGLTSAMISGQLATNPDQALTWLNSGDYDADLDPKEKAQLIGQAKALLELRKTQAAAAQANHAVGLQAKVAQAIELYKSGVDFAGFPALAGELKAAGQTELLQTLTNWKGDLDYVRTAQTLTPAALQAEHDQNLKLAESTADPIQANTYRRHAEIAKVASQAISKALGKDPLAVAVQAKLVAPTDMLGPLLSGNDGELNKALQDRQTARVQTHQHYGVFVPALTPDEQQGFMKVYVGLTTADEKAALLSKIAGLKGDAGADIANELKSLAGGGDIPMYLSFLSEDRALGHDIIAGAELLKRYPKLLPDGDAFERELDHRIGNLMAENPEQQLALRQAITDDYAGLLHSKRGEHGGTFDINLLNQAFARVTGGAFLYDNGNNLPQVIIPPLPGMTETQFENVVLAIDDNLLVAQSSRAALGSGSAAGRQRGPVFGNGRPVTARDIQEDGNFVWVGPGRYRVLINGAPVRDGQTGGVFVLDMNPLLRKVGLQ